MERAPLVFAGVDYLFPVFKEVCTYDRLLGEAVTGNPELWSATDLHERAWPLIAMLIEERRERDLEKYGDCLGLGRATNQVEEILPAAQLGAVATLFVDPAAELFGVFDAKLADVRMAAAETSGAPDGEVENLINLAAVLVLRNSGAVDTPGPERMPSGAPLAAVTRYPFRQIVDNLARA
jgi:hypothetical protein